MPNRVDVLFGRLFSQIQRNSGYLARTEIERILEPLRTDPKRLEAHGFKVYSQNDEDGIIEEIFRRLGVTRGKFVEIGVETGLECNSLYLIHKGWRGAWIEGERRHQPVIEETFKSILDRRLVLAIGYLQVDNIAEVFSHLGVQDDIEFLSIDIDGNDIYLLEALPVRPKVICIEYNAKFPPHVDKRQVYDPRRIWRGTDYMGASLRAIAEVAAAKDYRLVGTNITGANAFFVRNDLAGDLFPENASPEHLYNPPRYWLTTDHFAGIGHRADFGLYVDLLEDE